ncbi:MAG: AraC family transcriptional regulator [Arcobacter sp.]|nr:AraC family transcriptional regulator [Arcobacter sp.]
MKKISTINEHSEQMNEVIYYIHNNLSSKLLVKDLAEISSYSEFHFQRIFKEITNKSVAQYIKDLRLQCAANLLIFNPNSTITTIAYNCGFKSSATFSNEFKKYFSINPRQWRKDKDKLLKNYNLENTNEVDFSKIEIKNIDEIRVAYMRHNGYNQTIKEIWERFLYVMKKDYNITSPKMIAFLHNNPDITSIEQCRYVVCANITDKRIKPKGDIGVCDISSGLYATIRYTGVYNDILYLYKKLYYEWLPNSKYEALASSAYIVHYKNHFLEKDGKFDIEFRMPISYT